MRFQSLTLALTLFALCVGMTTPSSTADNPKKQHAISLFGAPQLPETFDHFAYVNPNAPKGGSLTLSAVGGFDNLNPFTFKGNTASGVSGLIYDTLLTPNRDEPSAYYGLVASHIAHAGDFSSATFYLRPQARFHDKTPLTAHDVVWSLEAIKRAHPAWRAYYADVIKAEARGKHIVHFTFRMAGNRELPLILGQLPILPKHFWTQKGRDLTATTLEIPLGSGAYRISKIDTGRSVTFERVRDYWAKSLNVNRGRHNFDVIRYLYFGDDTVALEALKAGNVEFRAEYSARNWTSAYDTPAVREGRLIREKLKTASNKGMQGFMFNTRRKPFDSPAIREAFNLAFDFEWTNATLFYNQYARTNSFFEGSELAARGLPSKAERALLDPWRDQLPRRIFTHAYQNPKSDGSGRIRKQLRRAQKLLTKHGWKVKNNRLMRDGTALRVEFLIVQANLERIIAPYVKNLNRLGIEARIRLVDPAQYQNRLSDYDFDIIVGTIAQSLSPGNEQLDFWGSKAAQTPGSRNYIGIQSDAVDALIDAIIFAKSRQDLVTATRALDRVLLWNFYVVPQWHSPYDRLAYWKGIKHPQKMPEHGLDFPAIWWRE